ncbi:hypothetical protein C4565_03430 [Candidatus Parcubacteria bacterium]|nr:MAG: hypothetical protein C4565_03430 [Candidatus Parcubacteria bacterium]
MPPLFAGNRARLLRLSAARSPRKADGDGKTDFGPGYMNHGRHGRTRNKKNAERKIFRVFRVFRG